MTTTTNDQQVINMNTQDDQIALEQEQHSAGVARFRKIIDEARKTGKLSETKTGQHILATAPVGVMDEMAKGMKNARSDGAKWLKQNGIGYDLAAYLTINHFLNMKPDSYGNLPTLSSTAVSLGYTIANDHAFNEFAEAHPKAMKMLKKKWSRQGTRDPKHMTAQIQAQAKHEDFTLSTISNNVAASIGDAMINFATQAGMVEITQNSSTRKDRKGSLVAAPSAEFMEWLEALNARGENLDAIHWPMIYPPQAWDEDQIGGYLSGAIHQVPFIKKQTRAHKQAVYNADMTEVYSAINAMQDTPWKVNGQVLAVYQWAVERPEGVAGLPSTEDIPAPPKPPRFDELEQADKNDPIVKEWKRQAAKVHDRNAKLRSKRSQTLAVKRMAEQFKDYPALYFPYNVDFRGRAYAVPMHLNPQGNDVAKSLLTFSQGKRLGEDGGYWLGVHGANVYGYDKDTMDGRHQWAVSNTPMILSVATDPLGNLKEWTEADKPWQFLAFCFEWAGYQEQGADFVSTLPVAMDGSCNGLQHFAGMARDEVAGAEVNLLPSAMPADIYSTVANAIVQQLAEIDTRPLDSFPIDPETGLVGPLGTAEAMEYAKAVLKRETITRKLTKKTVMTVPYGITSYGAHDQIEETMRELEADRTDRANPFMHLHDWGKGGTSKNDGFFSAASILTPMVMQAIDSALVSANECMDFLGKLADGVHESGEQLTWTTPDGFPVVQSYLDQTSKQVNSMIHGTKCFRVNTPTDKLDAKASRQGVSPNFVHSLDATAMRMYVNRAKAEGIKHFAMVHDSFGTLATDVPQMNRLIRESFVSMYAEHDVLSNVKAEMTKMVPAESQGDLPPVPTMGSLDLDQVHHSDYFFS